MTHQPNELSPQVQEELESLRRTVAVLKQRVVELQGRRTEAFAVFESMAHLEALVAERTEQLYRAKQAVEAEVERRTQELRRKADELERANMLLREMDRMKTHLLQNVSHELKTPLVSIRGYGELLRYRFGSNLNETQREFLDIIIRNADHLNRVIEDLVHASQQAKGISPFHMSRFDVVGLLREVLLELAPLATKSDVSMVTQLPDTPAYIQGEHRQLRQMFLNIVSNAIKFSSGCEERRVTITLVADNTDVIVSVQDTGIGIPRDRIHRIFDRFYQVDPTATRRYGGMGIGLSLVQEVVENHGGTIYVESEPGVGTTFKVRLPVSPEEARVGSMAHACGDVVDIVVVEDQPETAAFYETALRDSGFSVRAFTNPFDALNYLQATEVRVLLLDLSMPKMSGVDLLVELTAHRQAQGLTMPAVVLMTARSPDELGTLDLAGRVHTVLYKPFSLDALRSIFRRLQVVQAAPPQVPKSSDEAG